MNLIEILVEATVAVIASSDIGINQQASVIIDAILRLEPKYRRGR